MMILLVAIVVVLVITRIWYWWQSLEKRIPGPLPLPILGNILTFGNTPQGILKSYYELEKKYGNIFRFYVGSQVRIVISDADIAENIFHSNKHITKSDAYDLMKIVFREGLVTSTGEKWKTRRRLITPTFHFQILHEFLKTFNEASAILLQKLENKVGQPFDLQKLVTLYSFDIICETAIGVKLNAQQQDIEYLKAITEFFRIINSRFISLSRFDFIFRFTSDYKIFNDTLKTIQEFIQSVIDKKREENKHKNILKGANVSEEGIRQKAALLDTLLQYEGLSDEDLKEEINTFIFAGHDTTMATICFTALALANHQNVQQKLYQEITSYIHLDDEITINDLQNLSYLDLVVKETLRFYTILPIIERKLEEDAEIGSHIFKKDTIIGVYIYGLHHSEKYFPDPEKFDPDRFLPGVERHPYAFVPFSAGPRNCIGQKFAMLEIKLAIVKILLQFKILPVLGFKPDFGLLAVTHSLNGVYINLEKR